MENHVDRQRSPGMASYGQSDQTLLNPRSATIATWYGFDRMSVIAVGGFGLLAGGICGERGVFKGYAEPVGLCGPTKVIERDAVV